MQFALLYTHIDQLSSVIFHVDQPNRSFVFFMILFFAFYSNFVRIFITCLYLRVYVHLRLRLSFFCITIPLNVWWKQHIISEQGISNLIRWASMSPKKYSFNGLILYSHTHMNRRVLARPHALTSMNALIIVIQI